MIMGDTSLQMHFTGHGSYDNDKTYNGEAKERCNLLDTLMMKFWSIKCKKSKKSTGKFYPPYSLIFRINLQSKYMKNRITGKPKKWRSWVSSLASEYTDALNSKRKISTKW